MSYPIAQAVLYFGCRLVFNVGFGGGRLRLFNSGLPSATSSGKGRISSEENGNGIRLWLGSDIVLPPFQVHRLLAVSSSAGTLDYLRTPPGKTRFLECKR